MCSLFVFRLGRSNLTLSHCPRSSSTSVDSAPAGPRLRDSSSHCHFCACQAGQGESASPCHRGKKTALGKKYEQTPLSWLGNGSSVAYCCPDSLSKHPVIPNHFHTKGFAFCDLYTVLASIFKSSCKYYMEMFWIIFWHCVLQARDGLQLCRQALPAPDVDGHMQLLTDTVLSLALAS